LPSGSASLFDDALAFGGQKPQRLFSVWLTIISDTVQKDGIPVRLVVSESWEVAHGAS
jgi:hypothetical protein